METQATTFALPMVLEKSKRNKTESDYPIRIGISSELVDRQNERMILKSVFDDDTIDYHMKEGYVDYDHMSFRGKTQLEKAQAICGKPYDFEWVKKGGQELPVVEANLFRGNPYVEKAIIPALEHQNGVFGASIGGRTLQKSKPKFDEAHGGEVADIHKITWIHDAVTPLYKAVNEGTFIDKIQKSLEAICEDASCRCDVEESFAIKSWEEFGKAMTANEGQTNYVNLTGGGALQPQSLEEDKKSMLYRSLLDSAVFEIRLGNLENKLDDLIEWFSIRGMEHEAAKEYGTAMYNSHPQIMNLRLH